MMEIPVEQLSSLILPKTAVNDETRAKLRQRAQESAYFMAKAIIGFKDMVQPLHMDMSVWIGNGKIRKLGLVPRDHLKTSIWTIADSVRRVSRNADIRILLGNETATNASHFLRRIESVFERNALFQWLFPELIPDWAKVRKWNETEMVIPRPNDFPESTIEAIGVGGAVVSRHYKLIKLDDLVGKEASESPDVMTKTIDWYQYCESLLEAPRDEIQTYGTRWTHNDLYDWAKRNEKEDLDYFFRTIWRDDGSPVWPERFTSDDLARIRRKMGSFKFSCNPGEAPVLMSDFSEKPIAQIEVGDEVVGYTLPDGDDQKKLIKSIVIAKGERRAMVYKIRTEVGYEIRCTLDHQWFTGRSEVGRGPYKPVARGNRLMCVAQPSNLGSEKDWAYLAALIDGEGHCNHSCIQISQSETANPAVCRKLESILDNLNIEYEVWKDKRKPDTANLYTLKGGRQFKIDLLRLGDPGKKEEILKSIWDHPAKPVKLKDRVISITPDKEETVYSFETTSGNYVIWGYASKNCQYLNDPRDPEAGNFDRKWLRWYDWSPGGRIIPRAGDEKQSFDPKALRIFMRIDPAISEKPGAARSAIVVDGVHSDGRVFLLYVWARRCQPFDMLEEMFDLHAEWEPESVGIESVAYQRILKPVIEAEAARRGTWVNVIEMRPDTREKKTNRIRGALQPYLQRGSIWVNEESVDFLEEFDDFPNSKTLDVLDAFAYGPCQWGEPEDSAYDGEDEDIREFEEMPGRSIITGY